MPTPRGVIRVRWESAPRAFTINASLPESVSGEIELPVPSAVFARLSHQGKGLVRFEQRAGHWCAILAEGAQVTLSATK
jgi:hypothetical protein